MVCAPLLVLSACLTEPVQHVTEWPPDDFELVVEEQQFDGGRALVRRRLRVWADGLVIHGKSSDAVVDPVTNTSLPVFATLAAWRMRPETTRQLARWLHGRGVLTLAAIEGRGGEGLTRGIRLRYRAFAQERLVALLGQVDGNAARVLHAINRHLPAGDAFLLPGVPSDHLPVIAGAPRPVDDLVGAWVAHGDLLVARPDDPELLLDAFALACRNGDRRQALDLVDRWERERAARVGRAGPATTAGDEGLTRAILERMLPPTRQ